MAALHEMGTAYTEVEQGLTTAVDGRMRRIRVERCAWDTALQNRALRLSLATLLGMSLAGLSFQRLAGGQKKIRLPLGRALRGSQGDRRRHRRYHHHRRCRHPRHLSWVNPSHR